MRRAPVPCVVEVSGEVVVEEVVVEEEVIVPSGGVDVTSGEGVVGVPVEDV